MQTEALFGLLTSCVCRCMCLCACVGMHVCVVCACACEHASACVRVHFSACTSVCDCGASQRRRLSMCSACTYVCIYVLYFSEIKPQFITRFYVVLVVVRFIFRSGFIERFYNKTRVETLFL